MIAFLSTLAAATSLAACPSEGPNSVADLHSRWILEGWERLEGDAPFIFREKLGPFYDFEGAGVVIHDSYDPHKRVARSADEYGSFFESVFNSFRSAQHAVTDGPHVIVGRDLATSSLEFVARLEKDDGGITAARAQSQTVWRCTDKGWRIVREQNAVESLDVATADSILETPPMPKNSLVIEPGARSVEERAIATVRKAFDDWAAGTGNVFEQLLRDDTVWTIKGSGQFARSYTSRVEFLETAVNPFAKRLAVPVRPTLRHILADDNAVAVVWDGEATARDGKLYKNSFVWVFEMDGEKAARVTAFLDLAPYEEVLARLPE